MGILEKKNKHAEIEVLPASKSGIISEISTNWSSGLRTGWRSFRRTFWPVTSSYAGTQISVEKTRSLYRNDDKKTNLGAGVSRRIINSTMDFMGIPQAATGDEVVDEFLDNCMHVFWAGEILEMYRNASRDAVTVVRIRRDDMDDPLVSASEWEACYLEIVDPESCVIYYQMDNRRTIEKAYIRHTIQEEIEPAVKSGRSFTLPQTRDHKIIEEITPEEFKYYDETTGEWRDDLAAINPWGFVPLREVYNEWDSSLEGGQSDLEAVLPFIMALHDVYSQTLMAHKAHSIPKAKFRVNDMLSFLANNWPDAFEIDANGRPVPGTFNGEISWKGQEILFMQSEEDVEFLEAKSVLGDSKVLMEWIMDCICIVSEIPHNILFNSKPQSEDEMTPFVKKINRKREFFTKDLQAICKMALAINHMEPQRVPLSWDTLTPADALVLSQALQQDVMSLEVLATREVISDQTVRSTLRRWIPAMKSSSEEARDAKSNKQLEMVSPNSISGTDKGKNE